MQLCGAYHHDFRHAINYFLDNVMPQDRPGGAALAVYHGTEKVVDVWGGTKDRVGNPWQQDTVACSFSTTKGITSTLLHIVMDQHNIDYDEPIEKFWPAYGVQQKAGTTIRQALAMEAAIHDFDNQSFDVDSFLDWSLCLEKIAAAKPRFQPGSDNAYHAINYGFLIGGIVEGITGQPFQALLQKELIEPLDLDGLLIGVPESEQHRCADLLTQCSADGQIAAMFNFLPNWPQFAKQIILYLIRASGRDVQHFKDAFGMSMIADYEADGGDKVDFNDERLRTACIPGANGHFTARSLAKVYSMLANGGEWEGKQFLAEKRIRQFSRIQNTRQDKVIMVPIGWRMGYHGAVSGTDYSKSSFGFAGLGGSIAWCNPSLNLSMALTVNSDITNPRVYLKMSKLSRAVLNATLERGGLAGIGRAGPEVVTAVAPGRQ